MQILYATDGSDEALAGARLLAELPLEEARLQVLTVLGELEDREGKEELASAVNALARFSGVLSTRTRRGNPAEEILLEAEEGGADLIVLGSRGQGAVARFFLGSVAERVARHAPCPVLVARPPGGAPRRVLLGLDGSSASEAAAVWLHRFPLPEGCVVRLVTVLPDTEEVLRAARLSPIPPGEEPSALDQRVREEAAERLERLAAPFHASGRPVETELHSGHAALGLLDAAEAWDADLLAVGARGLSGIDRFLLGSVSEHVLQAAPCSVLIIRPARDTAVKG